METTVDFRANPGSNISADVSNVAKINTTRFTQTDLTIPPEEEEEEDDLFNMFNTTMIESFEGFCPVNYSIEQDSFEELVPKAFSTITEEPDNYYQLNFSDEFSDKLAESVEGFDPECFYIEENYLELPVPREATEEERQMDVTELKEMNSPEKEPSPRRLRSQGNAATHDYVMGQPLEYKIRKEKKAK
ncbi:UNVERIFIED_CONTAM: hypothetical protein RMT77_013239 [Armadillidium vulgare]